MQSEPKTYDGALAMIQLLRDSSLRVTNPDMYQVQMEKYTILAETLLDMETKRKKAPPPPTPYTNSNSKPWMNCIHQSSGR